LAPRPGGGANADLFRFATAPNGDAVLTHTGGTIRINAPPSLTHALWNALVIPGG
jgi:hypothetical protein